MKQNVAAASLVAQQTLAPEMANSAPADNAIQAAAQEWRAYIEPLLPLGEKLAAQMEGADDPQLRQELYRTIFMGMSSAYFGHYLGDPEYPEFLPLANHVLNWWAPNPDNTYYLATISGDGVYKISGYRGTAHITDFQVGSGTLFTRGTMEGGPNLGNYSYTDLHIQPDDYFEVILSGERPHGYEGDWWKLDAKATNLLIRQVTYDALTEHDGRFAIERLDRPAGKPRPSAQQIQNDLQQVASWAANWTEFSIKRVATYRSHGLLNKVQLFDLSHTGGVTNQMYTEGLFDLKADEALIYETDLPKTSRYWNIQLDDMLWRSIDYINHQTSLNGRTAHIDSDGRFRAVISMTDPGVPNWLDTAGFTQGMIDGRWTECSSYPVPTLKKVALADVRKNLPADTPVVSAEQRDVAVRLRRKGMQFRRKW